MALVAPAGAMLDYRACAGCVLPPLLGHRRRHYPHPAASVAAAAIATATSTATGAAYLMGRRVFNVVVMRSESDMVEYCPVEHSDGDFGHDSAV